MSASETVPKTSQGSYSLEHVAVAANRQANCASWGRNGLVAFSASKFVGIYDPISQQLLGTLPGHTDRVTSAQWIPNVKYPHEKRWNAPEFELVSSSVDKTLIIWSGGENLPNRPLRFTKTSVLKGHEAGITCIAVHVDSIDNSVLIASSASDGSVFLWRRDSTSSESSWSIIQVLKFGSKLVESLAFGVVPGSNVVFLACGVVDNLIHLFASDSKTFKLSKLTTLSGHESWVRSLSFVEVLEGGKATHLLLASASQDRRVRLWKFEPTKETFEAQSTKLDPAGLLAQLEANEEGQLEIEQHSVIVELCDGNRWSIKLESVILGHDEWVLSANWIPPHCGPNGEKIQPLRLLTASMDKTMVVWTPDQDSSLWIEAMRVGEVGGNHLGFFGSLYGSHPCESILALGYNGAFHLWRRIESQNGEDKQAYEEWKPEVTISGHFSDVKDIDWEPSGRYFVSVSKDQTARLWARWVNKEQYVTSRLASKLDSETKKSLNNSLKKYNWHEIGRPQVHGHDLSNITFQQGASHRFISCAEEKVLRVFDAPIACLKALTNLSGNQEPTEEDYKTRASTANVPALGLSNKPVYEKNSNNPEDNRNQAEKIYKDIHPNGGYGDYDIDSDREGHLPLILTTNPPFEEQLLQRTLWPEVSKLYGHGNELVTVTSSRKGDIIASACSCKVQTQEQAGIRIWDTQIWKETCQVNGASLTVTQMEFSHCDQYLLSVSRDRGVYMFKRNEKEQKQLSHVFESPKAHLRVVWSCSWTIDDAYIATGSRDKTIKIWKFNKPESNEKTAEAKPLMEEIHTLKFKHAVTAVAWIPSKINGKDVLAVGLESGEISLWSFDFTKKQNEEKPNQEAIETLVMQFDVQDVHVDSIKKMRWFKRSESHFELITCSSDHSIRLFSVNF